MEDEIYVRIAKKTRIAKKKKEKSKIEY